MSKKKEIITIVFLVLVCLAFFWKVILLNKVAFPGDLLVGAYFPWLEEKWGYQVGVPIKNGLLSDPFSQIFTWKQIAIDAWRNGSLPLWNSKMYSGYPLMANFASGVFYPLNVLLLLGMVSGWNIMVIMQVILSGVFMYLLSRSLKIENIGSVVAALSYSLSSVMIVRLEENAAGQVMIWVPALVLGIQLFVNKNKKWAAGLICLSTVLLVFGGHFQMMLYGLITACLYGVYLGIIKKKWKITLWILVLIGLGLGMAAIQIIPTYAMLNSSVRSLEGNLQMNGYGLLGIERLINLLVPDYFGNPATMNYWISPNYIESAIYTSVFGLVAIAWSCYYFKKLDIGKFFVILFFVSLFLIFKKTGIIVYKLNIPLLSNGFAGRAGLITVFSVSVLSGMMIDRLQETKLGDAFKILMTVLVIFLIGLSVALYSRRVFMAEPILMQYELNSMRVAARNLVWPFLLFIPISFAVILRRWHLSKIIILMVVIADLFRFGWKFTPFVSKDFVYPDNTAIEFVQNQEGDFRVDRESGPVMPPNTWMSYGLASPSGYDPLANLDYVKKYSNNLNDEDSISRYSELKRFDADKLGDYSVKYLFALRRNDRGEIGGDQVSYKINNDWKKVYASESVFVLENIKWKPRVSFLNEQGMAVIKQESNHKQVIKYDLKNDDELIVRDSFPDGWKAFVGEKELEIKKYNDVFRSVSLEKGSGEVLFVYDPSEVKAGMLVSFVSLILFLGLFYFDSKIGLLEK